MRNTEKGNAGDGERLLSKVVMVAVFGTMAADVLHGWATVMATFALGDGTVALAAMVLIVAFVAYLAISHDDASGVARDRAPGPSYRETPARTA